MFDEQQENNKVDYHEAPAPEGVEGSFKTSVDEHLGGGGRPLETRSDESNRGLLATVRRMFTFGRSRGEIPHKDVSDVVEDPVVMRDLVSRAAEKQRLVEPLQTSEDVVVTVPPSGDEGKEVR